jgi:hypothetical protein
MPISSSGTMMPIPWQGESISSLEQTHQPVIKLSQVCRLSGGIVAYALSPIDINPDFIPISGYLALRTRVQRGTGYRLRARA